mmetsp:Transcript_52293/g.144855  ORF Transcript_52293/g.144855 Transcript_52293/m.144855 type:complete len:216 (-) Transcript_52293:381-1028(-)
MVLHTLPETTWPFSCLSGFSPGFLSPFRKQTFARPGTLPFLPHVHAQQVCSAWQAAQQPSGSGMSAFWYNGSFVQKSTLSRATPHFVANSWLSHPDLVAERDLREVSAVVEAAGVVLPGVSVVVEEADVVLVVVVFSVSSASLSHLSPDTTPWSACLSSTLRGPSPLRKQTPAVGAPLSGFPQVQALHRRSSSHMSRHVSALVMLPFWERDGLVQ